jgi:hypothetical protein
VCFRFFCTVFNLVVKELKFYCLIHKSIVHIHVYPYTLSKNTQVKMFLLNLRNFVPTWTFVSYFHSCIYSGIIHALSLLGFIVSGQPFFQSCAGHLTCERASSEYEIAALYWSTDPKNHEKANIQSIKRYQIY